MDKHRKIEKIIIAGDEGIIIYFEDSTHSFISPDIVHKIIKACLKVTDEELPYIDLGHEY